MEPKIKVTKIKNRWHSRLLLGDKVLDEMACIDSCDIGWICREMLRWYVKTGGVSVYADATRKRQVNVNPISKVWYRKDLCNT